MSEEYSDMFSELSGHSDGKKYKSMAHVLFSFAGWTYEKWMDQQYTDPFSLVISNQLHMVGMACHVLLGPCTVGPSVFHMSNQQKKTTNGPCFHIPYYQSDQIIQKTCCCILHSFICLALGKKKIEN